MTFTRLATLVLLTLLSSFHAQVTANTEQRPNILFIAIDDLKASLPSYGYSEISAPNLDALASQGVQFNRAYSQWPVCGQSRVSLLTGLRPETSGLTSLNDTMRDFVPNVVTLPQRLKQHGYQTQAIGKIFDSRNVDSDHDAVSWSIAYQDASTSNTVDSKSANNNVAFKSIDQDESLFVDGKIATLGVTAINDLADTNQPFFLAVGFKKPHLPFYAPKTYYDLYDRESLDLAFYKQLPINANASYNSNYENSGGNELSNNYRADEVDTLYDPANITESQQRELIHGYYASVSYIDAQVGKLLSALTANNLAENTIVVLWGDHGFHLGEQGQWGKHSLLENANHVPMIIKVPGEEPLVTDALFELTDIYPTILSLANLEQPTDIDGQSQLAVITQHAEHVRTGAISQIQRNGNMGYSLRTDEYRYTEWWDINNKTLEYTELYYLPDEQVINGESENIFDANQNSSLHIELQNTLRQNSKGLASMTVPSVAQPIQVAEFGEARNVSENLFGYNGNMMQHLSDQPWLVDGVNEVFGKSGANIMRYPGGTIANYFDWTVGAKFSWVDGVQVFDNGDYTLENFEVGYTNHQFAPVYVLNLLTQTLQQTLDALAIANASSLPINYIELGNEFYLNDAEYTSAFANGTEFGQHACTFVSAIKQQYPNVKIAFPSTMKSGSRQLTWDSEARAACPLLDIAVVHSYPRSGLTPELAASGESYFGTDEEQQLKWTEFNQQSNVEVMLSQPFVEWQTYVTENNLPLDERIWITEFNYKDTVGPTRNTWAHALFNANQIQSYLLDGRVDMILMHNLITGAKAASFAFANPFDRLSITHGQGDLTAPRFGLSASGIIMQAFAQTLNNSQQIVPITISDSQTYTALEQTYDAVYGWQGIQNDGSRYVLVNTSSSQVVLSRAGFDPKTNLMRQYHAAPQTFVYSTGALNGGLYQELPDLIVLPPYSVTALGIDQQTDPIADKVTNITLNVIDDHHAKETAPTSKGLGDDERVFISGEVSDQYIPYFKFDLSKVNGTVDLAELSIASDNVNQTVEVYATASNWDEMNLTWNTKPELLIENKIDDVTVSSGGNLILDVTNHVNQAKQATQTAQGHERTFITFAIKSAMDNRPVFHSKEAGIGEQGATLTITASQTPLSTQAISDFTAPMFELFSESVRSFVNNTDNDSLVFSKVSGPAWLSVYANGTVTGMPRQTNAGTNSIDIVASNGDHSTVFTVNVNVLEQSIEQVSNSLILTPISDTYISQNNPDKTYATVASLQLRQIGGSNFARAAFFKYDFSDVSNKVMESITQAQLSFYSADLVAPVNVHTSATNWQDDELTWNNSPSLSDTIATTVAAANSWFIADVTDEFTNLLISPSEYSFVLNEQGNSVGRIDSVEAINKPYLTLTYGQKQQHWVSNFELQQVSDDYGHMRVDAKVLIVDEYGLPINNAQVTINFIGSYRQSVTVTTNNQGEALVSTPYFANNLSLSVTVTNVQRQNSDYAIDNNSQNQLQSNYVAEQIYASPTAILLTHDSNNALGNSQSIRLMNSTSETIALMEFNSDGFELSNGLISESSSDCISLPTLLPNTHCDFIVTATNTSPAQGVISVDTDSVEHPKFVTFVTQGMSKRQEAQHRVPPTVSDLTVTDVLSNTSATEFLAGNSYLLSFSVQGYHLDGYKTAMALFDCDIVDDSCAQSLTAKLLSDVAEQTAVNSGSISFREEQANQFDYQVYFTMPDDYQQNVLVLRLFYKNQMDNNTNKQWISLVIPGGLGFTGVDNLGRKIVLAQ